MNTDEMLEEKQHVVFIKSCQMNSWAAGSTSLVGLSVRTGFSVSYCEHDSRFIARPLSYSSPGAKLIDSLISWR
jgi:hypothetical protein